MWQSCQVNLIYFMETLKNHATWVHSENLWLNPKCGNESPPFSLQITFHPFPPCCVLRKQTSVPCTLDSASVWPVRGSRSQSDDGMKRDGGISPDPLSAVCRSAVATVLYLSPQLLPVLLSFSYRSQDSGNHFFLWPQRIYRSPTVVSLVDLPWFCPHVTNSPFTKWA